VHPPVDTGLVENFTQLSLAATSAPGFVGFWRSYALSDDVYVGNVIGPLMMKQRDHLLAGIKVMLTDGILDRIDEIVPPGTPTRSTGPPPSRARTCGRPVSERAAA
jgi:hypothetical protein